MSGEFFFFFLGLFGVSLMGEMLMVMFSYTSFTADQNLRMQGMWTTLRQGN